MKIAFIGLGRMGWHMAGHLARQNHALAILDANPTACSTWLETHQGRGATSVQDAVHDAEIVMTSLPADEALRSVWNDAAPSLKPGAIWIDHSTTSAEIARQLATAATAGGHFLLMHLFQVALSEPREARSPSWPVPMRLRGCAQSQCSKRTHNKSLASALPAQANSPKCPIKFAWRA